MPNNALQSTVPPSLSAALDRAGLSTLCYRAFVSCRRYLVFEDVTTPGVGVPLHMHRHEDEFSLVFYD